MSVLNITCILMFLICALLNMSMFADSVFGGVGFLIDYLSPRKRGRNRGKQGKEGPLLHIRGISAARKLPSACQGQRP